MVELNIPNSYIIWGVVIIAIFISVFFVVKYVMYWIVKWRMGKSTVSKSKTKTITETKIIEKFVDPNGKRFDDLDKEDFYFKAKPFTYFTRRKWTSWRGYKEAKMLKKFPDKVVLIRMEMNNGTNREFLVLDEATAFVFRGGRYVMNLEDRFWVVDSNIWAYDFHESISISVSSKLKPNPDLLKYIDQLKENTKKSIKNQIPANELKEIIEQSGISEVESSISPIVLERLIKSEIVQAILQGSALGRLFRVLLILIIIIVIGVGIDLVIDFIDSGILEEIGVGGGKD